MALPVQPQVVCTIKLWYQANVQGISRYEVYCMALPKSLEHEYITGNVFVNIL